MIRSYRSVLYFLIFLISFSLFISLSINLITLSLYSKISSSLEYRIGYIVLLLSVPSLILLLSEFIMYTLSLKLLVLRGSITTINIKRFLISILLWSLPATLILLPIVIIGILGVVNQEIFYETSVIAIAYGGVAISIYSIIHIIYAPYASLNIALCLDKSRSVSCTKKYMIENTGLLPHILLSIIVSWVVTSLIIKGLTLVAPILDSTLIPMPPQPPPLFTWSRTWFEASSIIIPRIYKLISDPIQYFLFAEVFESISRKKIEEILSH